MTRSVKVWGVFLVFTVLGFLLGSTAPLGAMIWPVHPGEAAPTSGQLAFFILLSGIEAISFGIAACLLFFGWPAVSRLAGQSRTRALGIYLPAVWLLGNWVPHSALHMSNGPNLQRLLYIEYGFHATLMLGGIWLAASFLSLAREGLLSRDKAA